MSNGSPVLKQLTEILHGDIETNDVTVSGGPTLLPATPLRARKFILVQNNSGADIYLGGSDVTIHDGFKVSNSGEFSLDLGRGQLYATNAASASGIRVIELA